MERLTTWRSDNRAAIANNDGATPLQQTMKIPAVIDRLAIIEDILGDEYDLDCLRELVEADRDGRCEVLPCKTESYVFANVMKDGKKQTIPLFVRRIDVIKTVKPEIPVECVWLSMVRPPVSFSDFGKWIFTSREAAEAALKGEQNG